MGKVMPGLSNIPAIRKTAPVKNQKYQRGKNWLVLPNAHLLPGRKNKTV
jgi:hypothetical protein